MFRDGVLRHRVRDKTILLANPPFDSFRNQAADSSTSGSEFRFFNKASQMLWHTIPALSEGAVFGIVLPQSFLHAANARELRDHILRNCELRELCLFPDKVFSFSDAESAILIGRRKTGVQANLISYRRIREPDVERFRSTYEASSTRAILQSGFTAAESRSFRFADLDEVWSVLRGNPSLKDIADVGQGLIYESRNLPIGSATFSERHFEGAYPGFVRFDKRLLLHQLPKTYWMNLDSAVIRRPMSGTETGTPQVLLNYAPASRGPWRLKALFDTQGHAVSSRFIAVRPRSGGYSLEALWAVLNSPVANAYAFTHLGKRDNIVGDIRRIPLPRETSLKRVREAVAEYVSASSSDTDSTVLMHLLLQVDYEVLRLYALPPDIEQALLTIFNGWKRVGVPFLQEHVPDELQGRLSFL